MDLKKCAKKFRVRLTLDECGDEIILGRYGQIYVHSDNFSAGA